MADIKSVKDVPAAFRAAPEQLEIIKRIAYWERLTMKEIMAEAMQDRITKYVKKNGEPKPIPKKN